MLAFGHLFSVCEAKDTVAGHYAKLITAILLKCGSYSQSVAPDLRGQASGPTSGAADLPTKSADSKQRRKSKETARTSKEKFIVPVE